MRLGVAGTIVGLLLVGLGGACAPGALGAETYAFDAALSLTGDCTTSPVDPVPDPPSSECESGPHPPSGQFVTPRGTAVDSKGDRYVASYGNTSAEGKEGRIDVFDSSGLFLSELLVPNGPRAVAVDSEGNLYVYESTFSATRLSRYEPKKYLPEAGEISYSSEPSVVAEGTTPFGGSLPFSDGIAVNPANDHLFVDYESFIGEFSSAKEGNKPLDSSMGNGLLHASRWIAVDASNGRLYASDSEPSLKHSRIRVFEIAKPHALLKTIEGPAAEELFLTEAGHLVLAAEEARGHFFVEDLSAGPSVYEFNENYEYVSTIDHSFQSANDPALAVDNGESSPDRGYLFVSSGLNGKGHSYAFQLLKGPEPPEVESISVGPVAETDAELRATINPRGSATHYVFEYVSAQLFEEEGFASASVAGEGDIPSGNEGVQVSASATGLLPGTAYRFRVIVKNECEPGGCSDEAEDEFRTYPQREALPPCANEALRSGMSLLLPDCRAYELVTPPDTNGRAPRGVGFIASRFLTLGVSPLGEKVSFVTEGGSIPGTEGTGAYSGDRYLAVRGPDGWTSDIAGPSGTESEVPGPGSWSSDQGFFFWETGGIDEGTAAIGGTATTYIRYPDGHSELVGRGALGTDPEVKGDFIAPGGTHIIFTSANTFPETSVQLEENAPPTGTAAVYDRTADEVTHVVSLLPGDVTPAAGEDASYVGASVDGVGVAFSIGNTLYLRYDNQETYEIGEDATFAGIDQSGTRVFYIKGGNLFAFDVKSEEVVPFSESADITVVNLSSDGTTAYFVSPSVLTGEPNPDGATAQATKQNLYLSQEGEVSFVGTVSDRDVEGEARSDGQSDGLGLWTTAVGLGQVGRDPSRTTPNGSVLLFESRADLSGSDPGGHAQVYRYDATANELQCLSCVPTGVEAGTDASLQSIAPTAGAPPPASSFGFVPNLRSDGRRAFFQSSEPLVLSDTDGVQDVYEWEEEGVGSCGKSGGCIYLISSGHSARDNFLYGVSGTGDDVFFMTSDLLTSYDADGTVSIYDARVNGGFAEPPPPCPLAADCPGEGASPPLLPSVSTEGVGPSGNVPPPKHCAKGKRRIKRGGAIRCVSRRHRHKHHNAGTSGKGGRK